MGIFWSVIGILVAGGLGGLAGWWLIGGLGIGGTPGAIVAVLVAMVVATAVWVALTVALRRMGIVR
ncbi:MAG: hypothetical protein U1F10_06695 [Burkholderiales bacterium]